MTWVLIITTWVLVDSGVLVNVATQSYPTEQACETARFEWKPPQPVTTWAAQCQKLGAQPQVILNVK